MKLPVTDGYHLISCYQEWSLKIIINSQHETLLKCKKAKLNFDLSIHVRLHNRISKPPMLRKLNTSKMESINQHNFPFIVLTGE